MNYTFRSSESLPSLHSFQSLQKRFNESRHSSVHLLAYLAPESVRSLKNITTRELNEINLRNDGSPSEPPVCYDAWWSDFIELKPFKLRPLSNFGVDLTANNVPTNRTEASRSGGAPTRPRHRPPPLDLNPRIVSSRKENVAPSIKLSQRPKFSPNETEFDSASPWHILNQFPTPPTTPLLIRGSKTSTSLYKPSRRIHKAPPLSAPIPKDFSKEQMENKPALQVFRKKRQSSFGSLGKAFKTIPGSVPCTPPPIPPAWLQFDPMSEKEGETKSLSGLQRRETFKSRSRLFSFSTSPKASPRNMGTGDRRLLSQPSTCAILHHGNQMVSESARKSLSLGRNSKHSGTRSRSASQPTQFKGRRDKIETDTPRSSEDIPHSPIDLEKHIIIPKRRTQSQSYINLYVPPWKQVATSPMQIAFPVEGGISSMPTTPIGGNFDLSNETMHLPASGSVQSLTAELDPFGAGEPTSFFRSDYGASIYTVEVDQATSVFYDTIGMGARTLKKRWPVQQSVVAHCIPDIVVSSSRGLQNLNRRNWVVPN
ncbi:unnamed protein product [Rhizoctonia solani]|uniref:Uncharacterized protein n=1 Tax=Rhizoctonia solani TaxID=456999 RepID=A0A8H2Y0M3_9AGAM|nr:unnamed protein product [Rhizoctonia solani]